MPVRRFPDFSTFLTPHRWFYERKQNPCPTLYCARQQERVLTGQENLRYTVPQQPVDIQLLVAEAQALKQAVLASASNVRQGVDETTRQVNKQASGYTRRIA